MLLTPAGQTLSSSNLVVCQQCLSFLSNAVKILPLHNISQSRRLVHAGRAHLVEKPQTSQRARSVFATTATFQGDVNAIGIVLGFACLIISFQPSDTSCCCQVLFLKLLDTWLDRFDSIGSSPARKQSALALCLLLPVPIPAVLHRLPDAIAHITAVCFEVCIHLRCISHDGIWKWHQILAKHMLVYHLISLGFIQQAIK